MLFSAIVILQGVVLVISRLASLRLKLEPLKKTAESNPSSPLSVTTSFMLYSSPGMTFIEAVRISV